MDVVAAGFNPQIDNLSRRTALPEGAPGWNHGEPTVPETVGSFVWWSTEVMAGDTRLENEALKGLALVRFALWPSTSRFLDSEEKRIRNRRGLIAMFAWGTILTAPGVIILIAASAASSTMATVVLGLMAVLLFLLPGIYGLVLTTRIALALRRL